ncbi:MAG: redoxin domain-containing protein [Ignavibacteria bacterium]|nr:redoxin domain-containing protein [Ignavibacteria bacterium]
MFKKLICNFIISISLIIFSFITSYAADDTNGYNIGDIVEDFTIYNYDGSIYTLSNNEGPATIIMFWSTQCPFVQPYTQRISNLTNEFINQGIVFWAVNSNNTEDVGEVQSHAQEKGYPFPMLKDLNNVVADQFGAERTPEIFVINNSNMKLLYHGRIDNDKNEDKVTSEDLKNALNEFLAGKEITVTETKAFGCTIKRVD